MTAPALTIPLPGGHAVRALLPLLLLVLHMPALVLLRVLFLKTLRLPGVASATTVHLLLLLVLLLMLLLMLLLARTHLLHVDGGDTIALLPLLFLLPFPKAVKTRRRRKMPPHRSCGGGNGMTALLLLVMVGLTVGWMEEGRR
jgi:hypothetical protein